MRWFLLICTFAVLPLWAVEKEWMQSFPRFISTQKETDDPRCATSATLAVRDGKLIAVWDCDAPAKPVCKVAERDGTVWEDDGVELFLRPALARPEYYHFIINSSGILFDQLCRPGEVGLRKDWNARGAVVATEKTARGYRVRLTIPLENFYCSGDRWEINLARTSRDGITEYSSISGTKDGFHNPGSFLEVKAPLLKAVPGAEIANAGERIIGNNRAALLIRNDAGSRERIQLRLDAGGGVSVRDVVLSGMAEQEFEIDYRIDAERSLLTLEVLDSTGRLIFTSCRTLHAVEPLKSAENPVAAAVTINRDLVLNVNGKKVFPLILYRAPQDRYAEFLKYGFNAVETTNYRNDFVRFDETAARAKAAGVGFLPHEDYAARRFLKKRLAKVVARYRHEPSLWAWYLADEPQNYGISPEGALDLYRVVKGAAPELPVMMLHSEPRLFAKYAPACDIFTVDNYPVPKNPIVSIADYLDRAYEAVENRKPVWFAAQTFASFKYGGRFPTREELRCMIYLALAHRAKGLMFFAYTAEEMGGALPDKNPDFYREVLTLAGEVRELAPLLTAPEPEQDFELQGRVHARLFSGADKALLLLVNPYPTQEDVAIAWHGRTYRKTLEPYQVLKLWKENL